MATYSWKGTTATWSTATNWQTGGIPGVTPPGVGDDCVFDGSDGGSASAACTLTASTGVKSVNFTGYSGTFTHNSAVNLTIGSAGQTAGVAKWVSGMTYTLGNTATSALIFDADGGTNAFTSAGKTFGNITTGNTNAGATVQLQDTLTGGATATLTHTKGTLDANNQNLSFGFFASSNANTRVILMGSGTWTMTGTTGAVWNITTPTNLTLTCGTSTLLLSAVATATRILLLNTSANGAYNNITVTNASNSAFSIFFQGGAWQTANLTMTNVRNVQLVNLTGTVTGVTTWTGPSASAPGSLFSGGNFSSGISVANAVSVDWITVNGVTKSGAGTWTSNNSFDTGFPSSNGMSIVAPGSGGGRIIGG